MKSITPYQSKPFYSKSTNMKKESIGEQAFSISETVDNTRGSTPMQRDHSTIHEGLSGKHDIRNATFGEMTGISKLLYAAGEVFLKEHATLTFDFESAKQFKTKCTICYLSQFRHA